MAEISLLVTVKSYPALSSKYGEAVCVAGIRTDTPQREWVRLFPVQYREMPFARQFHKYQQISLSASKHGTDTRPETYRPDIDSLRAGEVIRTDRKHGWDRRREFVDPLLSESMCELIARQQQDGTSLGAFRPATVLDLLIDEEPETWDPRKAAIAAQPSLLAQDKRELEKIPLRFRYRYRCSTPGCRGHTQTMIDWEIGQSYRKWRHDYSEPVLREKIVETFRDKMCAPERDTIFFVGNQLRRPTKFLVLGLFWPPKQAEPSEVGDRDAR